MAQRKRNGHPQDDYWALKAWAQGVLGRRKDAEASLENAIQATNKKTLPDLATTYYRAGMAMQALGDDAAARDYWKRAAELDPRGKRGTLANAALRAQDASAVEQIRVG
jgi:tetratricopeptide (TPR) repeat protein